ncbi:transcriptional regulator [Kordiimonas sediminis]|uniref:Transcriptional regulator n=1 Tax=Kordiimonas sediminis TaxID=1735581 RepID=A0A919APY0_9PROT|nr:helix-turn-helix domain-containing protein [Kordiimonas sediminis]GHF17565.1 transcriptional regulator [Kordiimonas sediminis]
MSSEKYIRACSIWRALEIVGDVPTLLILESSFLRVTRFDQFLKRTEILRTLLSDRLRKLVNAGCLEKKLYCEKPKRYEYVLTKKGLGLYNTALMMLRWENKWGANSQKIQVTLTHSTCGKNFQPAPACDQCHEEYTARDIEWKEGPGNGMVPLNYQRRRQQTSSAQERQNATTLLDTITRIIGDRWATLIIRSCFTGINTYDEMLEDTGMATNILANRLKMLTDDGFLSKKTYQTRPNRYRYKLTDKGLDIYPILMTLLEWGETWYSFEAGPPLILSHKACGKEMKQEVICSECREVITPDEVEFTVIEASTGDETASTTETTLKNAV